ncbi:hypothetical_protein [Leishmania braziliensis MHOM/BR/75/M2904]|nr:hypothetical_protein [Leishmania braziliensis MHOM/BR/75/M2904]
MLQSPLYRRTASSFKSSNADVVAETTMTIERQVAGLKSRERLRRDQERQLRQLPFLYHRVNDLQDTCERLEQELASAHQRVAAFQQEALALRSLIKFTERPELASAAEGDAAKCVLKEEVRELRRCVQRLEREKELSLRQSEEACKAAEFYKQLCDQLYNESLHAAEASTEDGATLGFESVTTRLPRRHLDGITPAASTAPSMAISIEAQMKQLHGALEFERARSSALEETVSLLQAAITKGAVTDMKCSIPERNSSAGVEVCYREDHTSGSQAGLHHAFADDTRRSATRLKRLVAVLRSENCLLTQRVAEVVARNMHCIKDIAALKLANKHLELCHRQESSRPGLGSLLHLEGAHALSTSLHSPPHTPFTYREP